MGTATVLVLSSPPSLARLVEEAYAGEVDRAVLRRLLGSAHVAPRTTWVNEIAQRYAFERAVCDKRGNAATTFLEMEILKSECPHCGAPGFWLLERIPGLPCRDCDSPTEEARAERRSCVAADYCEIRDVSAGRLADPYRCATCNLIGCVPSDRRGELLDRGRTRESRADVLELRWALG